MTKLKQRVRKPFARRHKLNQDHGIHRGMKRGGGVNPSPSFSLHSRHPPAAAAAASPKRVRGKLCGAPRPPPPHSFTASRRRRRRPASTTTSGQQHLRDTLRHLPPRRQREGGKDRTFRLRKFLAEGRWPGREVGPLPSLWRHSGRCAFSRPPSHSTCAPTLLSWPHLRKAHLGSDPAAPAASAHSDRGSVRPSVGRSARLCLSQAPCPAPRARASQPAPPPPLPPF